MLEFNRHSLDDVEVLTLKGNLDALTAPELRPTIDELVAHRKIKVGFELRELTLIDSSGRPYLAHSRLEPKASSLPKPTPSAVISASLTTDSRSTHSTSE